VLQARYPPSEDAYTTWFSDVEIHQLEQRSIDDEPRTQMILSVGSMEQRYKRFDVVLNAFEAVRAAGLDVELTIVGTGRHLTEYEEMASRLGVAEFVSFTGQLAGALAVRDVMRSSDLFVLASDTEGLPRVVIEAMSCGLPCIATQVGGIPELLDPECLVPAGDARALTDAIIGAMSDLELRKRMSERNLARVSAYLESAQNERRRAFCAHVRATGGAGAS
jgi:glycosyltransferase involved in cell wall biosynthesis